MFFYYGDYNVQQVPFLIFAHRAVREGRFFWNPLVDLGGNMTGCFAFYIWGSPFFWITVPFPESWIPYMTPFLMALKYGTAMASSYAWIRTQTRTQKAALAGAMLYAFSGFQACNIVFQHFHDVTAFFPLFLLAFDRMADALHSRCSKRQLLRRAIPFILMTALMSVINYYFFFGQVIFLILYYFVRFGARLIRTEGPAAFVKEVLCMIAAGVWGLLLAAFFLVQSVGGILGNARVSNVLDGCDLIVYPDAVTPLAILRSLFMVPDLIARGTLFSTEHIKNGSLAFYLPCFAMAGVFAYWQMRRKDWKKTLLMILAVMAFVPVLCALFSALNEGFYARWFYLPVLLCACMTAEALEEERTAALTRGSILSLGCTAVFILLCFLPVKTDEGWSFTAICENRKLLNTEIKWTLFGAGALVLILLLRRGILPLARRFRQNLCLLLLAACCLTSTYAVLKNGSSLISRTGFEKWKKQMLTERPDLGGEDPGSADSMFFRVETESTSTNYEMVWGYPTMHCFESTVHPSIFTWYRGIGMIRTVESTLPMERIGARAIMSVRWYLENTLVQSDNSYTEQGGIRGYRLVSEGDSYNVYETENAIPMGFTFDSYMTEDDYRKLENGTVSDRVLVKDLILSEEMAEKYGQYMRRDTDTDPGEMSYWDFTEYCIDRRDSACTDFSFDKNGWHASADMENDNLVFFSIPYDRGFTVTVDGQPAELVRADFGLSAVFVPAGEHTISASYLPVGFRAGMAVSIASAVILLLAALLTRRD